VWTIILGGEVHNNTGLRFLPHIHTNTHTQTHLHTFTTIHIPAHIRARVHTRTHTIIQRYDSCRTEYTTGAHIQTHKNIHTHNNTGGWCSQYCRATILAARNTPLQQSTWSGSFAILTRSSRSCISKKSRCRILTQTHPQLRC